MMVSLREERFFSHFSGLNHFLWPRHKNRLRFVEICQSAGGKLRTSRYILNFAFVCVENFSFVSRKVPRSQKLIPWKRWIWPWFFKSDFFFFSPVASFADEIHYKFKRGFCLDWYTAGSSERRAECGAETWKGECRDFSFPQNWDSGKWNV